MAKEIPTIVKIISILHYVGGGASLLLALLFLIGAGFIGTMLTEGALSDLGPFALLGSAIFVVAGIFFLVSGGLWLFVAYGLWKLKNWARITAIVLASISVLYNLFSLLGGNFLIGPISLIIKGGIIYYLAIDKETVKAFI